MSKGIKWSITSGILAVSLLAVMLVITALTTEKAPAIEYGQVSIEADTQEALKVIGLGDKLVWEAGSSFDTSRFHEVYVNDPSVPLNKKQEETNKELKYNAKGFLDGQTSMIKRMQKGAENIKKIDEKAKAEGRKPSGDDFKAYFDKGEQVGPYPGVKPYHNSPVKLLNSKLDNGGRLIVEAHILSFDARYIMVKTKEGMRIAGAETIKSYI
jgi:hypothetical protein